MPYFFRVTAKFKFTTKFKSKFKFSFINQALALLRQNLQTTKKLVRKFKFWQKIIK